MKSHPVVTTDGLGTSPRQAGLGVDAQVDQMESHPRQQMDGLDKTPGKVGDNSMDGWMGLGLLGVQMELADGWANRQTDRYRHDGLQAQTDGRGLDGECVRPRHME